ncbi:MAG: hypothetical protein ACI867_002221, partial [Glaciecola sp.]
GAAACSSEQAPSADGSSPAGSASASEVDTAQPSDAPPSASQSPSDDATTSELAALREPGPAVDLGPGTIAAVTADGQHVLVHAPVTGSDQLGCEGQPFDVLWSVDVRTGDRVQAIEGPESSQPANGRILLTGDGHLAIVEQCEGYLGDVLVGDIDGRGNITNLTKVALPPVDLRAHNFHWMPGDKELVATGVAALDSPGVWVMDPEAGDWLDIDNRPLNDWIPLGDGRVAEISVEGRITLLDAAGVEIVSFAGDEFVAGPEGLPGISLTYSGGEDEANGVTLVHQDGAREVLSKAGGSAASFAPGGKVVAWSAFDPDTFAMSTILHDLTDGREFVLEDVYFAGLSWLDSGVAYVAAGAQDESGFAPPVIRYRHYAN